MPRVKRRRRPAPDLRPDWRNPNMPVIRRYTMRDGTTKTEVDPDYEHRYREFMMTSSALPSWRDDPTYNLRKKP